MLEGRCTSTLPPVVMTTALDASSSFTKQRDGAVRRRWAASVLRSWMERTNLSIVVVDGTFADRAALEFLRPLGPPSRLELLPMPPIRLADPEGQGKGYLEYRSIAFAAAASASLRGCDHFAHATGNRFIPNAEELLAHPAARHSVAGVRRHTQGTSPAHALWTKHGPWVKSDFVLWSRGFLRDFFNGGNVSEVPGRGEYFEVTLARSAMRAEAAGHRVLWWPCVSVEGWSGSKNQLDRTQCGAGASSRGGHGPAGRHGGNSRLRARS